MNISLYYDKLFQTINYLNREVVNLNIAKFFKILFMADVFHAKKFNRLICGGNYVMINSIPLHQGESIPNRMNIPVLIEVLNMSYSSVIKVENQRIYTSVPFDKDQFSASDLKCLKKAIKKFNKGKYKKYLKDVTKFVDEKKRLRFIPLSYFFKDNSYYKNSELECLEFEHMTRGLYEEKN